MMMCLELGRVVDGHYDIICSTILSTLNNAEEGTFLIWLSRIFHLLFKAKTTHV